MTDWLRGAINELAASPDLAQVLDYVTDGGLLVGRMAAIGDVVEYLRQVGRRSQLDYGFAQPVGLSLIHI